jgi:predicted nuclease of predicted toxin-antitoxin system
MAAIRLYLDEDVHPFIADALRLRGWEALTTVEAGRRTTDDREQLTFAAENGYVLLTYNIRHFPRIHYEMVVGGKPHAGIIVAVQDDPRRNIRALFNLLTNVSAEAIHGNLVYLNRADVPPGR